MWYQWWLQVVKSVGKSWSKIVGLTLMNVQPQSIKAALVVLWKLNPPSIPFNLREFLIWSICSATGYLKPGVSKPHGCSCGGVHCSYHSFWSCGIHLSSSSSTHKVAGIPTLLSLLVASGNTGLWEAAECETEYYGLSESIRGWLMH